MSCSRCEIWLFLTLAWCFASARAADSELERALAAEVEQFVKADRVAPPAACQVLFVGSSSIVKWQDKLAADMAPIPVINRGFGGSHIEYINRWFDQVVAPYHPRAEPQGVFRRAGSKYQRSARVTGLFAHGSRGLSALAADQRHQ
jgi:hypothetical protein